MMDETSFDFQTKQFITNIIHRVVYSVIVIFSATFTYLFVVSHTPESNASVEAQRLETYHLLLLTSACFISYFALQGSDPGYLPSEQAEHTSAAVESVVALSDDVSGELDEEMHPDTVPLVAVSGRSSMPSILANDQGLSLRSLPRQASGAADVESQESQPDEDFCQTCSITRPIRSHHCKQCRRCVATFDHHCSMMQTCIGELNHCRFVTFLSVHLWAVGYCWLTAVYFMSQSIAAVVLFVVMSFFILLLVSLLGYQLWLVTSATTSLECNRGSRLAYLRDTQDFDLPFAKCFIMNILEFFLCRDYACLLLYSLCVRCDGSTWTGGAVAWQPHRWKRPGAVVRDSEDVCAHPWQNKYYSCC